MSDDVTIIARCKDQLSGYTFNLFKSGHYIVTHPEIGIMDEGQATMGDVHAEDAATYMDAWLEELRCIVADYKRFG